MEEKEVMPYQDDKDRDYTQFPFDLELEEVNKEINEFSNSVVEISNNIRRMGVNFDIQYVSTIKVIETLLQMLFNDEGPMPGRQVEFFWRSNRAQLELVRQVYAQAMEAKLSVPQGTHLPPFPGMRG